MKKSPSKKLETVNDLGSKARDAITKVINPLVADAFALYVKTKNYHWHLSGPHFRDYHLLFDEQAAQIYAIIDILAERVRKLGGLTIHSIRQISQLQNIPDDDDNFVTPREMLIRLLEDNRNFTDSMRDAHEVCEEYGDVATTSILEVLIDESEKRVWFLFESAQVD